MEPTTISLALSALALILAFFAVSAKREKTPEVITTEGFSTRPLQLQAYERLVLLCERMALPNLISRVSQPGFSIREMQLFLIETVKQEYEYNASQQIYVSQASWDAVRNLKDQTLLIINSIAKALPPDGPASDLNRKIMEGLMQDERAALHTFVTNILNEEAKKIM
jgi:hypothetical protein